jgi:hypothetical protein
MKAMDLAQRRKNARVGVCFSSESIFLVPLRLGVRIFLRVSDFVALTKPEITFLVLLATAVGGII